jgi:hypothetical protein
MSTRQSVEVMRQIRLRTVADSSALSPAGTWIAGVVTAAPVVGRSGATVQLDSGGLVDADSSLDEALPAGMPVWALTTDGVSYLVVGLR